MQYFTGLEVETFLELNKAIHLKELDLLNLKVCLLNMNEKRDGNMVARLTMLGASPKEEVFTDEH
jgi:hypothetical protein